MVLFNYASRELTAKIVYYGPGLCGKTTNLQFIHQNLPGTVKGKMLSLATKTDRTLFFDFLPIDIGEIRGMKTRVQLYTVPGQVFYNETRKLVLKGADGIVFVADSQQQMEKANVESFRNLEDNLKGHGMTLAEMPHVIQFNKRDLPNLAGIEEMNAALNKYNAPFYESVATTGIGVQDTLKAITKLVLVHLTKKYDPQGARPAAEPASPPEPALPTIPSAPPAPAQPPAPAFAEQDIDRLVSEVEQSPEPLSIPVQTPADGPGDSIPLAGATPDVGIPLSAAPPAPGQTASASPASPSPDPGGNLEVDMGFDPDWSGTGATPTPAPPGLSETPAETPIPVQQAGETAAASPAGAEVLLTQAAHDDDLFNDPSLEVARLSRGEMREIVVPVLIGEGPEVRRFKLSVTLKVDPAD